jgi:Uma2 family endonuclease
LAQQLSEEPTLEQPIVEPWFASETKRLLPTMYDLPSENPEEPGLPDEFHDFQPELLRRTFQPPNYSPDEIFSGSDLNLYYDLNHSLWYKRPDWFGVVGVPSLYGGVDLRQSYVIWQESVVPIVVVEILSPGTESEDLGQTIRQDNAPPSKWQVYEQILQVPYYIVFDQALETFRAFFHQNVETSPSGCPEYQEVAITKSRIWLPQLALGLGVWRGVYETGLRQIPGAWLRWYNASENWVLTDTELAQQEAAQAQAQARAAQAQTQAMEQRLEQERQKRAALLERLKELGIDPEQLEI